MADAGARRNCKAPPNQHKSEEAARSSERPDQLNGFSLHLREPTELKLTNKPAPSTSLPNNHQSRGKQKLSLWVGSQYQLVILKGNKMP